MINIGTKFKFQKWYYYSWFRTSSSSATSTSHILWTNHQQYNKQHQPIYSKHDYIFSLFSPKKIINKNNKLTHWPLFSSATDRVSMLIASATGFNQLMWQTMVDRLYLVFVFFFRQWLEIYLILFSKSKYSVYEHNDKYQRFLWTMAHLKSFIRVWKERSTNFQLWYCYRHKYFAHMD